MLRPERSIDVMSSPDPHHFKKNSVNESVDDLDHGVSHKYPDTSVVNSPANNSTYHHRHGAHLQVADSLLPRAVT